MSKRVAVFIDGSNLYHTMRQALGRFNIDLSKFSGKLCGDHELTRVYYYNAPFSQEEDPATYSNQQRFFNSLYRVPNLQLELGRLEPRYVNCKHCKESARTFVEKGVDIKIAVRMLSQAHKNLYDIAILVSADGDFAPAIFEVKDLGKRVIVAAFIETRALLEACDQFVLLNDHFLRDCWR